MNDSKDKEKRSRTYTRNSRHNIYDANLCNLGVRVSQTLKRKIEVAAKSAGDTVCESVRKALEEKYSKVVLTSDDYILIARKVKEQEERNAAKIAR